METGIDRKVSNRSFLDAINRDVDNGHINMTPTNIPDDLIPLIEALLGKSEMAIEMLEVVKRFVMWAITHLCKVFLGAVIHHRRQV